MIKRFYVPWWILLVTASLVRVAMFTETGQQLAGHLYASAASAFAAAQGHLQTVSHTS